MCFRFAQEMSTKEQLKLDYEEVDVNYSFYARTAGVYMDGEEVGGPCRCPISRLLKLDRTGHDARRASQPPRAAAMCTTA